MPVKKHRKVIRKTRRIKKTSIFSSVVRGTKVVCAKCGADWRGPGSPGYCPDCGERSYALVVERRLPSGL